MQNIHVAFSICAKSLICGFLSLLMILHNTFLEIVVQVRDVLWLCRVHFCCVFTSYAIGLGHPKITTLTKTETIHIYVLRNLEVALSIHKIPRLSRQSRDCGNTCAQSRDCITCVRNHRIPRMRNAISRLRKFSDCVENIIQ